ncbi:MAG: Hint domain-containing protein [Pararhodobacter sp.]
MPQLLQFQTASIPIVHQHERPTGFVEGTPILTNDGDRPVEILLAGDIIMTRDNGLVELRGTSTMVACDIDLISFWPCGGDIEHEPPALTLPAMQQVMVDDWRARVLYESATLLTPAGSLVDGIQVLRSKRPLSRLFRLHFDRPQLVLSRGFALASEQTRAPEPFGSGPEPFDETPVRLHAQLH